MTTPGSVQSGHDATSIAPGPHSATRPVRRWLRRNLFRGPVDSMVTVVAGLAVGYLSFRILRFVFLTGRWEVIRVNLTLFMVGRYDRAELWRPALAVVVASGLAGLLAGGIRRRQVDAQRASAAEEPDAPQAQRASAAEEKAAPQAQRASAAEEPAAPQAQRASAAEEPAAPQALQTTALSRGLTVLDRLWPALAGLLLILVLTQTPMPWLAAGSSLVALAMGRGIGFKAPRRMLPAVAMLVPVALFAMVWFLAQPLGWDDWGGIMLNLFLAAVSIVLCFPLGVLLALGRRSEMPLIRAVSTGYIELIRGVPLIALLLMASVALGFFIPSDLTPGTVVRAIVVFTLFTAAYIAEIVRGGLQSVPRGQVEAGKAVGLSPVTITFSIELPQALRNVIPSLVGQFISLFKDTTLAGAAMGFLDLLSGAQVATAQPAFRGQGLIPETLLFVAFVFWVGSYTMSRESQRLERRLGVGER